MGMLAMAEAVSLDMEPKAHSFGTMANIFRAAKNCRIIFTILQLPFGLTVGIINRTRVEFGLLFRPIV